MPSALQARPEGCVLPLTHPVMPSTSGHGFVVAGVLTDAQDWIFLQDKNGRQGTFGGSQRGKCNPGCSLRENRLRRKNPGDKLRLWARAGRYYRE